MFELWQRIASCQLIRYSALAFDMLMTQSPDGVRNQHGEESLREIVAVCSLLDIYAIFLICMETTIKSSYYLIPICIFSLLGLPSRRTGSQKNGSTAESSRYSDTAPILDGEPFHTGRISE